MSSGLWDFLNLLRCFSFPRLLNYLKVFVSFYWSKWTGKASIWGDPISISIEPTTACNLGCPECPSGLKQFTRPEGNLKEGFLTDVFAQLKSSLFYATFYFQGEPFIHPQFLDLIQEAKKRKLYTATSTNAHFLNDVQAKKTVESGLDRLIISIDGTTQETYEKYRVNGKLDKVIEGTKNIIRWKKELKSRTPYIIFQFLVVSHNEHQTEEVKQLGKELGVDEVKFKTAQLYDYENGNALMPKNEKFSRYKLGSNGKYQIKNPLDNQCWRMWQGCVLTWDGLVVPCCFDKDAKHQMGDLKIESFNDVWNSEGYNRFRSAILKSRSEIDICTNCTEGTKVWEDV
ncbi:MAG: radical SAM protein [Crocinitomicaceae bacterium]|nr:radical SAM protein [Crocinitomicaceae bacterium]|tara:strand:+ start:17626 stop:18654 length:1029 start_codon:yes stop_codon:yes gene_type:complete